MPEQSWIDRYLEGKGGEVEAARSELRKKLKPIDRPTGQSFATNLTDAMNAALGGALESGTMAGGAWAGGAAGARTGNPWLTALGTLAGGAYGAYTGGRGREAISSETGYLRRPSELPEERRAWSYLGETIGQGLPIVAAPFVAAGRGFTPPSVPQQPLAARSGAGPMGERIGQDIRSLPSRAATAIGNLPYQAVEAARRAPTATAIGEIGALGMAGAGSYSAEKSDPGNEALRAASEIGFGMVHPVSVARRAGGAIGDLGRRVKASVSERGIQEQAGRRLREGIEAFGGDPETIAKQLAEAPSGPTAMVTDDPYLRLETELVGKRSPTTKRELEKIGKERQEAIVNQYRALADADPQVLRQRAAQRVDEFSTKLDELWRNARAKADVPITRDEPRARTEISRNAQELVEGSLRQARGVESQYWDNLREVVGDTRVALSPEDQPGILSAYQEEIGKLLPVGESLPPVLNDMAEFFGKNRDAVPLSDVIKFRSKMLDIARRTTDPNDQKYLSSFLRMADAAEAEIEAAANATGDGAIRAALDDARGFTRALHDSFTRTFAGDTLRRASTGEERIIPETILKRAFGAGREIGETQFKDLTGATAFLPDRGFGDPEAVNQMRSLQDRYLRLMANEKRTGEGALNINALRKWMNDNQGTLDQFPALRKDLESAMKAQNKFSALSRHYRKWTTPSARKGVFAELANTEDPVRLLSTIERSKAPQQELLKLANTAKRSGPAATEGLATAAVENELRHARTASGEINFPELTRRLKDSVVLKELNKRGVLNDTQIANMRQLASQGENIQSALGQTGMADIFLYGTPGETEDLATRLIGANIGGQMAPGGSSLVAAGAASRYLRNIAQKTPQKRMEAVLEQAMLDKDFAADLIRMTKSKAPTAEQIGRIRAYLWQAGLVEQGEEETSGPPANP